VDLHRLDVAGAARGHLGVGRVDLLAAGVPGGDADDAGQLLERWFHAPEAATGESCSAGGRLRHDIAYMAKSKKTGYAQ